MAGRRSATDLLGSSQASLLAQPAKCGSKECVSDAWSCPSAHDRPAIVRSASSAPCARCEAVRTSSTDLCREWQGQLPCAHDGLAAGVSPPRRVPEHQLLTAV